MFLKLFILIIIFLNLGIPLNDKLDIILLLFSICIIVLSKKINFINFFIKKINFFILIIIITLLNNFIPKFFFNELHQVFINKNDIEIISKILPQNLNDDIHYNFYKNFDFKRLVKSNRWDDDPITGSEKTIDKAYAYSIDAFLQKNKFSRINSKINFSSREELRIGKINTPEYNLIFDKEFRRILPYIVLYELDNRFNNSKVCFKGNLYYAESNQDIKINDIKKLSFIKKNKNECFKLNFNKKYSFLFGYSINEKDNLKIKLDYNFNIKFLKFIKLFLTSIIIFLFTYLLYDKKRLFDFSIYAVSILSTLILTFIRDFNLLVGLRYYRGGADGLLHYGFGRDTKSHTPAPTDR